MESSTSPANDVWMADMALLGVSLMDEELELERKMKSWRLPSDFDQTEIEDEDDYDEYDGSVRNHGLRDDIKKFQKLGSNAEYEVFARKYGRKMKALVENKKSTPLFEILSLLESTENWKLWLKLLIDIGEALGVNPLLEKGKGAKDTCLHEAITRQETSQVYIHFIRFLGIFANDSHFRQAIAITTDRNVSCIHSAIAQVDDVDLGKLRLVRYLVEKADPDTLIQKREKVEKDDVGSGNTCMHDVVDIRLCKAFERVCQTPPDRCKGCARKAGAGVWATYHKEYLQLIKCMTAKQPESVRACNISLQSPFLFHKSTAEKIKSKTQWLDISHNNTKTENVEETSKYQTSLALDRNKQALGIGKRELPATKDRPTKPDNATTSARPLKHKPDIIKFSRELSNQVTSELRESCLSQDSFLDVCQSLFGKDYPRAELTFKVAPLDEKTTDAYGGLPLEPLLADVEISLVDTSMPSLGSYGVLSSVTSLSTSEDLRKAKRRLRQQRDKRGKLIVDFFQWLRDVRHVEKIIKLSVYDDKLMPCTDEVIQKCLSGFDIRYLDWDKDDLCISRLAEGVAPNLKELWLSWSGRNTALLGWSNKEQGLYALTELKTVNISTTTELESPSTCFRNIDMFRKSLSPRIDVKDSADPGPGFGNTPPEDARKRPASKQINLWLEAVEKFRTAVQECVPPEVRKKGHVAVAVLDTGVQLSDFDSGDGIHECWYADRKMPNRGSMNTWYHATDKHGTEMIRLIRSVCPYAKIYVAKLDIERRVYGTVAHSAAEAIKAAISKKVNVISMSWTITNEYGDTNGNEGITKMMEAISDAGKSPQKTVMFCSTDDQGKIPDKKPFPATGHDAQILKCIGSAGVYGEPAEYVDKKSIDYLFPGKIDMGEGREFNGSSAATALAAGLAALIIWCASLQTSSTSLRSSSTATGVTSEAASSSGWRVGVEGEEGPIANQGRLLRRATGLPEEINFQENKIIYELFESLVDPTGTRLVNVTDILQKAAKAKNPPKKLIELAMQKIGRLA